jgi:hypothetical protein
VCERQAMDGGWDRGRYGCSADSNSKPCVAPPRRSWRLKAANERFGSHRDA